MVIVHKFLVAEKVWDLSGSGSVVLPLLHFSEPLWSEASPYQVASFPCVRVHVCVLRKTHGNISVEYLHSSRSVICLFCKIWSVSYASYQQDIDTDKDIDIDIHLYSFGKR